MIKEIVDALDGDMERVYLVCQRQLGISRSDVDFMLNIELGKITGDVALYENGERVGYYEEEIQPLSED